MVLYSWEYLCIRPHFCYNDKWNENIRKLYWIWHSLRGQQTESSNHFRWNLHCVKNENRLERRALKTCLSSAGALSSELFTPCKPEAKPPLPQNSGSESLALPQSISVPPSVRQRSDAFSMQSNLQAIGSLLYGVRYMGLNLFRLRCKPCSSPTPGSALATIPITK